MILQPVTRDDEFRVFDCSNPQLAEQFAKRHLQDFDVFVPEAAARSAPVRLTHLGKINKNALRRAAGGREELGDKSWIVDLIAGFLHRLANDGRLRCLVLVDHPGDGFGDPTIHHCIEIAPAAHQSWQLELPDQHHGLAVEIQQQRCHGVTSLEHQPPLIGAHRAVKLLVRDAELVDFEEIIEDAFLPRNGNLADHVRPPTPSINYHGRMLRLHSLIDVKTLRNQT